MQNVSFRNVEEFLEFLPDNELKLVTQLRKIIFDCIPGITERLSFNVPFYKKNKDICFIWPGSVLWGKKQTYEGVRFGFTQGYLLMDDIQYLNKGNRKQVHWKEFTELSEFDLDLLKTFLFEAEEIDKTYKK